MPDSACPLTEETSGEILVWDAEGVPDADFGLALLWRSYEAVRDSGARVVSIPRLVEENADDLRARYLAWVHALGEAKVDGRAISEHLLIRPGLSYWWMASPAQKCNISATSLIPDAIKLLAIEKLLAEDNMRTVVLHSANARLAECLASHCRQAGRHFEWRCPEPVGRVSPEGRVAYGRLPRSLRALLSFGKYCVSRLPAIFRKSGELAVPGSISFFDVLVHLDKRGIASGRFVSNYWGPLVGKLFDEGVATNWFHFYYPHPAVPTFAAADRLVQQFRRNAGPSQFHGLIDALPSVAIVFRAWRDYLQLRRMSGLFDSVAARRRPEGSDFDLWPLHEDEWVESVAGPSALMECLRLGMFEAVLARLPRQQAGVYISENQPWEMSLIHAWRQCGHGRLVATPHSTVRYWDLRYFYDPRSYVSRSASDLPLPDCYAVNGPVARAALLAGGCPEDRVVEVEALRFMHLGQSQNHGERRNEALRILICGDFLSATNDRIFDWLGRSEQRLPKGGRFIFKPHPAFPYDVNPALASRIALRVDERPLAELLPDCDVVITSAITSAAVDAYCAGKRVIQIPDGGGLNANALRGLEGACLATTPNDLSDALHGRLAGASGASAPYFRLEPSLAAWQRLLGVGHAMHECPPSPGLGAL
jgi:surface carbohydrate biosynthesis protein (TIGR04326 family)